VVGIYTWYILQGTLCFLRDGHVLPRTDGIHVCVCACVCVFVCVFIYIHVYMYACIHVIGCNRATHFAGARSTVSYA